MYILWCLSFDAFSVISTSYVILSWKRCVIYVGKFVAIGIVSIIIVNNITEMIIYFVFPDLRSSFESVYIYKKKRIKR